MKTDRNWNIFLTLLRGGLWERDVRLKAAPAPSSWESLRQLALDQAVLGLFLRGVAHLPEDQLPPPDERTLMQAWEAAVAGVNVRIGRVESELLRRLRQAGVHPIIQKGSAAACHYVTPELRQGGDIDVFCPEFDLACSLVPDARPAPDGTAVFVREGVTVELHPRYYDLHRDPSCLPPPETPCGELLLLSAHILKHAVGAGVGCKQLCDMARALDALTGKYDKSELEVWLRRAGLLRWHRLLCSLLVEDLGLDPACCLDGFRPCHPGALRRIVRSGGHFGRTAPGRGRALKRRPALRKIDTALAFLRRLPFSLRYAPRETFATIGMLVKGNIGGAPRRDDRLPGNR